MSPAFLRQIGRAAGLVALCSAAACAPRAIEVPPAGMAARFPDYVFPAVPEDLGTPAARERHQAGWLWLQAGDFRAAERNFNAALKLAPVFYPSEAGLGYLELARKEPRAAVERFTRALGANTGYVPALVGRGEALLAVGERDLALESFEAAVAADPSLAPLRTRIELLRFRGLQDDVASARKAAETGRFDEARALYSRALEASPQSPFLYRELATVERRAGNLDAALAHAARAAEMEPGDARAFVLMGELHEARGDLSKAAEAYSAALALEHNEPVAARLESVRERLLMASLPPEFQQIERAEGVSRAELAALLGVRLDDLLKRAPRRNTALMTDTRSTWAAPWILAVTGAGVMEPFPNHTFQPEAPVRRRDLAEAASRVLSIIAAERPQLAQAWRNPERRFPDVPPAHLNYPAAAVSVEAGVLQPQPDGSFQPSRPVTGAEAVEAVRRLEELAVRLP
ncbi:MAG TPA: tetratricopeptide repeat protein [Vicinamibacterales bacterium]|nr:tetratricopeptide repeat protein [Vicinamibacterales bacterium]